MKKIFYFVILIILMATTLPAQKVNFTLNNGRLVVDQFLIDVYANVNTGQIWNVGPTCIRIRFWTIEPNGISLIPEDPVMNANANLSNNTNYFGMTSTSILSDTAVSLNIQQLNSGTPFSLSSGSYWLGTLKFNYILSGCCINMAFLDNSAIFNGLGTPMVYTTDWTYINPPSCILPGVRIIGSEVPSEYKLSQNYPNPFNPSTSIKFSIPKSGFVSLKIYDVLGREVADLVNQVKSEGTYIVDFDASKFTTGMYFYKLEVNDFVAVKKMVLVK
jgi:hypothetical protein